MLLGGAAATATDGRTRGRMRRREVGRRGGGCIRIAVLDVVDTWVRSGFPDVDPRFGRENRLVALRLEYVARGRVIWFWDDR